MSDHQKELEHKDVFYKVEKERVAKELQAAYNEILPALDDEHYECGYGTVDEVGYTDAKAGRAV